MNGKIKEYDMFGQPIPINYAGEDTFKTLPGGMLSVVVLIMVISYMILKFKYMYNHEEWSLTQQIVLAQKEELVEEMKFSTYPNVSIAL